MTAKWFYDAVDERHDDIMRMLGADDYRRRVGSFRGGPCLLLVVHQSNQSARSPKAGSGQAALPTLSVLPDDFFSTVIPIGSSACMAST